MLSTNEKIVFIFIAIFILIFACWTIIEVCRPHEPVFIITAEEREMLARLTDLEAGICSPRCKRAVVSVVFNMRTAGYWGDTLEEVIYYPNAFSPAYLIEYYPNPSQEAYDAVDYVCQYGVTIPEIVRYFRADRPHNWAYYETYIIIDNVYFGYFTDADYH